MKKEKKHIVLPILYTLLVFCAIDLFSVQKSNSKFFDQDNDALGYEIVLQKLYYGSSSSLNRTKNSTSDTVYLQFNFLRNTYDDVSKNNTEKYYITLPTGCSLVKVNNEETTNTDIEFDSKGTGYVRIDAKCNKDTISYSDGILYASVNVYEQIGTEAIFLYRNFIYKESISDYDEYISGVVASEKEFDEIATDRYEQFKNWIIRYSDQEDSPEVIWYVITSTYNSSETINYDSEKFNKLNGLSMTYDESTGKYKYSIEDNLIGYAKTAYSANKNGRLYFYTENRETVETAFEVYLEHIYPGDENKIYRDEILEYIESRGGISSIIFDNKIILGVSSYNPTERYITLGDDILEYATSLKDINPNNTLKLEHNNKIYMGLYFNQSVSGISDDILSPSLKIGTNNETNSGNKIYSLLGTNNVRKNNTQDYPTPISFIDYYIVYDADNSHYVLVRISSDAGDNPSNNYNLYKFDQLKTPDGMNIEFANTGDNNETLTIKIKHTNSDEIVAIMEILDEYFGVDITVTPEKDETTGEYYVEYSIVKDLSIVNEELSASSGLNEVVSGFVSTANNILENKEIESSEQPDINDDTNEESNEELEDNSDEKVEENRDDSAEPEETIGDTPSDIIQDEQDNYIDETTQPEDNTTDETDNNETVDGTVLDNMVSILTLFLSK